MKKVISLMILLLIFITATFFGCASIQKKIDTSSLSGVAKDIQEDFRPGNPEDLRNLIKDFSLETETRPLFLNDIKVEPLDRWEIKHPLGKDLIMEKISFPSLITHEKGFDRAVFYIYRSPEWKDKDVILWAPGMAVSDFAFHLIKHFFDEEIKRDYNIVFYVPPFHLERTEEGKENSEGLFTADVERNVKVFLNTVRELRTISEYLRGEGVQNIGGWGGSIGATMLLLTSQMVDLDHLCIMIPILDWGTVLLNKEHMGEVVSRLGENGFDEILIRGAYDLINPVQYELNMNPERIHVMYGEYDQLTPPDVIIEYAQNNGISKISSYERSHATILLTRKLYQDYGLFLDTLK
ncbi:MAG: hypothetical protein JW932_04190 [Deltaproteobacteria bacterium]|nr:hypothetical protein [Deltaproteobacteria bacterium]